MKNKKPLKVKCPQGKNYKKIMQLIGMNGAGTCRFCSFVHECIAESYDKALRRL